MPGGEVTNVLSKKTDDLNRAKSHDNLYSDVIVTQLLRDRFTLVTNHGQNDVCSLWM